MITNLKEYKTPRLSWSQALRDAFSKLPDGMHGWHGNATRMSGGGTIVAPAGVTLTELVVAPTDKNWRLVGEEPWLDISWEGDGDYMIQVGDSAGYNHWDFEDLIFHGGGVSIAGNSRRAGGWTRCGFSKTVGKAIETLGPSVVGKYLNDVWIDGCKAGVDISHPASDLWTLNRVRFLRNEGVDYRCESTGARENTLEHCSFEIRPYGFEENSRVVMNEGELATLINCKFGGEVGNDGHPPKYDIQIGPTGGGASGTLGGFKFIGCRHYGRNGGPTADSAVSPFYLGKAVKETVITGAHFKKYHGALVTEAFSGINDARDNQWVANCVDTNNHSAGIFSGTGKGWVF
jgi:hypothetical protein